MSKLPFYRTLWVIAGMAAACVADPWKSMGSENFRMPGSAMKAAEGLVEDSGQIEARAKTLWRSEAVDGVYFAPAVAGSVTSDQGEFVLDSAAYTFTSGGIVHNFATVEGEMYRLDFWILTPPKSMHAGTGVIDVYMDGYPIGSFVVESQGTAWTWQQFSLDFTAENGTTWIEFLNAPNPSSHFEDLDKIIVGKPVWEISEVPEPGTGWLMAVGLSLLAFRRVSRKRGSR